MADVMPYDPKNKKCAALVRAGLMKEGGAQPVAKEEPKQRQERTQAP